MISFKIPQKIPMNLGYYWSPTKVTESNQLASNLYIGISLGGLKAYDLDNHRYIYFLQSENSTPALIDEYMVPQPGHVYLLSSHASTFGGRDTWLANETSAPAGIIAYYTGWNSVQNMEDGGGLKFQEQVNKGNLYPTEPSNTTTADVPSPGDEDVTIRAKKVNGVWTSQDGGSLVGQMSVASYKSNLNDIFGPFIKNATGFEYGWVINNGTYVDDVKNFNEWKNKYNYIWDVTLTKNNDNTYLNEGKLNVDDRRLKNWNATKMAGADVGRRHDIAALPALTLNCFYKVVKESDGKWKNKGYLFPTTSHTAVVNGETAAVYIAPYPSVSSTPNPRYKHMWSDKTYLDIWWSYVFGRWMRADDNGVPPVEAYKEGMGWNLSYGNIYMHNKGWQLMFELVADPGPSKWDVNNVARIESAYGPFRMQYKGWIIEGTVNFIGTTMKWIDDNGDKNPYVKSNDFDAFTENGTYVMYDHQTNKPRTYDVDNKIFPVITVKAVNAIATNIEDGKRYKYSYSYNINNPSNAPTINNWTLISSASGAPVVPDDEDEGGSGTDIDTPVEPTEPFEP